MRLLLLTENGKMSKGNLLGNILAPWECWLWNYLLTEKYLRVSRLLSIILSKPRHWWVSTYAKVVVRDCVNWTQSREQMNSSFSQHHVNEYPTHRNPVLTKPFLNRIGSGKWDINSQMQNLGETRRVYLDE